jgi:hypothetical protein
VLGSDSAHLRGSKHATLLDRRVGHDWHAQPLLTPGLQVVLDTASSQVVQHRVSFDVITVSV